MSMIESKLTPMGLTVPAASAMPNANRIARVQVGSILFLSGHGLGIPLLPGVKQRGKVPSEVSEAEAYQTAKAVALTMLSTIKAHTGDLDRVKRVVRLFGMVNADPDFERHFAVIDGASDLFVELWGPVNGQHARSAVGMGGLPRRIAVEINGEFELHP